MYAVSAAATCIIVFYSYFQASTMQRQSIVLSALVILSSVVTSRQDSNKVSCQNENGKSVDWCEILQIFHFKYNFYALSVFSRFIMYKVSRLPGYYYMDSDSPKFKEGLYDVTNTSNPVARTVAPMYDSQNVRLLHFYQYLRSVFL